MRNLPGTILEWSIDVETFLPARVETLLVTQLFVTFTINFSYSRVNQPIPDEDFRLKIDPERPQPSCRAGTAARGLHGRFLNVKDGSDGRMSVRRA